jgi:5-methyltetrahydrofolate--homocysteine methyltransferase
VRIQHARKKPRTPPVTLAAARDNDLAFDWASYTPPVAHRLGVQSVEASIETLRNYIDWTPFFMTWSLAGKYRASSKTRWWAKKRSGCSTMLTRCWIN